MPRALRASGERDRPVTIEQSVDTTGGSGFPVETWTTLVSPYWMHKEDLTGAERFHAAQLSASFDTRWTGPYRDDLDPDLVDVPKTRRLVYLGKVFDIVSARQLGRRQGVELMTLGSGRTS